MKLKLTIKSNHIWTGKLRNWHALSKWFIILSKTEFYSFRDSLVSFFFLSSSMFFLSSRSIEKCYANNAVEELNDGITSLVSSTCFPFVGDRFVSKALFWLKTLFSPLLAKPLVVDLLLVNLISAFVLDAPGAFMPKESPLASLLLLLFS